MNIEYNSLAIHSPREVTTYGTDPIRAIEMVRAIRDAIYEETKDLSREELKAFFAREAAAMRQENLASLPEKDGAATDDDHGQRPSVQNRKLG